MTMAAAPFIPSVDSGRLPYERDSATNLTFYMLTRPKVEQSAYEMIPLSVTMFMRHVDGETWASWGDEHAISNSEPSAALELWDQLGHYLESLQRDQNKLSQELRRDLGELQRTIRPWR